MVNTYYSIFCRMFDMGSSDDVLNDFIESVAYDDTISSDDYCEFYEKAIDYYKNNTKGSAR